MVVVRGAKITCLRVLSVASSMLSSGYKSAISAQKPRSKVAPDQKGAGVVTIRNVATARSGEFFFCGADIGIRVRRSGTSSLGFAGVRTRSPRPLGSPCR